MPATIIRTDSAWSLALCSAQCFDNVTALFPLRVDGEDVAEISSSLDSLSLCEHSSSADFATIGHFTQNYTHVFLL